MADGVAATDDAQVDRLARVLRLVGWIGVPLALVFVFMFVRSGGTDPMWLVLTAGVLPMAVMALIAAHGLRARRPWSRAFTLTTAVLMLPSFPVGTALGVYALVVLFAPGVLDVPQASPRTPS